MRESARFCLMTDARPPRTDPDPSPGEVTTLLLAWSAGDREAVQKLIPLVYGNLRKRADGYLRRERAGHTLQPTALVNDAYLKLVDQTRVKWQNRAHFFGVASRAMREVLVDYARRHRATKRGASETRIALLDGAPGDSDHLLSARAREDRDRATSASGRGDRPVRPARPPRRPGR
jgi:RNA polymerase sigma factor (TIGR02999 family)